MALHQFASSMTLLPSFFPMKQKAEETLPYIFIDLDKYHNMYHKHAKKNTVKKARVEEQKNKHLS